MNLEMDIKPEELFLIKLCRIVISDKLKNDLWKLSVEICDWDRFASLANDHGVAALAYNNLEVTGLKNIVPQKVISFLRNAYFMSLARNTGNLQMMREVLDILNREDIKTVLLKGTALELMVYGNKGLRQMNDVDVLTTRDDSLKAYRILKKSGYIQLPEKSVFHKMITGYYGKHLPSLVKNNFSLELHHELFNPGNHFLTEILLNTSEEADLGEHKVWLPKPQILFLYLIKHLHSHELKNDSQLRLYTDLVVMIDQYGSDIIDSNLIELAKKSGMDEIIAGKLWCLRNFWGVEYPEWLIEYAEKLKKPDDYERFIFFLKSPEDNPLPNRSGSYRSVYKDIPGFHRKALYLLGDLFPSISFMKKRYACSSALKALLYYPHRWGKVLWMLGR